MPQPLAYADTSFLIALYGNDDFTAAARTTVQTERPLILLCELNRLEFENALRLLRFRKLVTPRFVADAMSALQQDAAAGLLHPVSPDWPSVFEIAQQMSERRTVKGGHRAMDVLHVAAARAHPGTRFYSYDDRQRRLAQHEGLALNV